MTLQQSLKRNREVYLTISEVPQTSIPDMGQLVPPDSIELHPEPFSGNTEIVFSSERVGIAHEKDVEPPIHEEMDRIMRIKARRRPELTLQEELADI